MGNSLPYPATPEDVARYLSGYSDHVRSEELRAAMLKVAELLRIPGNV